MTTKLIVHKFEKGTDFKSLRVTIDKENGLPKYSEWTEGEIYQSRKSGEKSRLIIKLVSGDEISPFNLDVCAKSVKDLEILFNVKVPPLDHRKQLQDPTSLAAKASVSAPNQSRNRNERPVKNFDSLHKLITKKSDKGESSVTSFESVSPLEYSLARVSENNARILENILLLNRTLDYAKKKEMLEATCPKNLKSYPCITCGKCFVYETGLKRHYAIRHAMLEALPRWQDVWTCVECFQVWPRKDVAVEHAKKCCKDINTDSNVREIKTSSLLQCEFCEKVFTSIPRLLKHVKIHTTKSNYECNPCKLAFTSYKEAENHWLDCTWLKLCYYFSLPKMLLCNACDRKFRNYEQLYNHRYKAGHLITKTHNQSSMNKSLGILVYQCEICGMWFPFITTLKTHRTQCHPFCDSGMQIKLNPYWPDSTGNNESNNKEDIINNPYWPDSTGNNESNNKEDIINVM